MASSEAKGKSPFSELSNCKKPNYLQIKNLVKSESTAALTRDSLWST